MNVDNLSRLLINPRKSKLFIVSILAISAVFMLKFSSVKAQDISVSATNDCTANSVMWCGANSVSGLINKYDNGDGHNSAASIQHIYDYFGISASDIDSMSSSGVNVESGWVGKNGHVYDSSNKLIATNAITGGRQNIAGSTEVSDNGTVFFVRPPSVSFESQYLAAYVVMDNGQFKFAILASCGNAVKATPVATTPAPKPVTTKATTINTVTPAPATTNNSCSGTTVNTSINSNSSQGGNCSTNTTVVQTQTVTPTAAAPAPTPTQAPATTTVETAPTNLINTGPGDIIAIFAGISAISAFAHHMFIRKVKALPIK